ncbi:MAG: hypothetical protein EB078_00175 [Proteobacteria bacterium]|nr:hypothetical protein [Pseudomonadota bacterium]NDC23191.1 hypothetical protein [Pseudomonadota bacterium]NDD03296.1 hypothetical protein [Pseudomonadota bacterium]NDG26505.1 hypothetical protein [Pseudomonadota bacterium]
MKKTSQIRGFQWLITFALLFFCWGQCFSASVGFLAFGDSGSGDANQKTVARATARFCQDEICQFVLLLGDNIYPSGVESYQDPQWQTKFEEPYESLDMPFYPTLGNHDYRGSLQAQIDFSKMCSKWKFPSRYYGFQKEDVDFFVIDTENFDDEQVLWLKEQIALSRTQWKIVYGHRPIFSHGMHGDTSSLKEKLLPLLKNRIDFYFSGHDHNLEYLTRGERPDFIVSGAASEHRPVSKGKSTVFASSQLGFAHLLLTKNKALFRFLDEEGDELFRHNIKK